MSDNDFSKLPVFDPDSIAGKRVREVQRASAFMMLSIYGYSAFALATTEDRAVALGLMALRSGWSADRVVAGLASFTLARERREAGL